MAFENSKQFVFYLELGRGLDWTAFQAVQQAFSQAGSAGGLWGASRVFLEGQALLSRHGNFSLSSVQEVFGPKKHFFWEVSNQILQRLFFLGVGTHTQKKEEGFPW